MADCAVRQSPFALRVVQRKWGRAAIVYRRQPDGSGRDRLQRVAALSPLAFRAAQPMLRDAVWAADGAGKPTPPAHEVLTPGQFHAMDAEWGVRVGCFALIAAGLRDGERLLRAADHLRHAAPDQAAWWLGLLTQPNNSRPLRALRILTEAVE